MAASGLKRVAVVGAGLAGFAAGLALKERGFEVEIFERTRLLGGRATSFVVDGHEVDNGQHVFLGCCDAFIAFVARLGMRSQLHLQERFDVVVLGRGVRSRLQATPGLPAPLNLAWSLLHYAPLGLSARLGIGRALLAARGALGSSEPFDLWLRRHGQGTAALRAFWEPFVVPALNAPLERLSTGDAAFVLVTAFLGEPGAARFGWSKVPLAHIAAAAAARLDRVHTSTPVASVEVGDGDVSLILGATGAGGERRRFDGAVLAVPPPQLGRLLGDPLRYGIPALNAYEARAIVDIHIWHDAGPLGFAFAALVGSPVQWIFQKSPGYLCCSVSAADDVLTAPSAELVARAWEEVRAALPELRAARIVRDAVTRNPTATYTAQPGTQRPGVRTAYGNLTIAGAFVDTGWPDTMESAVRSGTAAAAALEIAVTRPGLGVRDLV